MTPGNLARDRRRRGVPAAGDRRLSARLGGVLASPRPGRSRRDRVFDELCGQFRALMTSGAVRGALMPRRRSRGVARSRFASPGSGALRPTGAVGKVAGLRWIGPPDVDPRRAQTHRRPQSRLASDRAGDASGLTQRYAAIWDLADTGASPDVIARATGQPIGQIELILGLSRQIDGTRTNIPCLTRMTQIPSPTAPSWRRPVADPLRRAQCARGRGSDDRASAAGCSRAARSTRSPELTTSVT